jgi:dihydroorotate dehydrogenase (NAD+) catalytic subunit
VSDVRVIARAVEAGGADAISAINTLSGLALDRQRRRPLLGNTYGGLSGPAIKPVALRIVYEVAQTVRLPIVAVGGVTELDDVLDYLLAGASAVQVGTAIFADPGLPVRLAEELAAWCAAEGLASHRELIGAALPRRDRPSVRGVEYRP